MRATNGSATRQRRNRVLKAAKGFRGGRHRLFKTAKETLIRGGVYAFADRRRKKREFRRLWITRLTAAAKLHDMQYSRLIQGLAKAEVRLNRKELSELAIHDPKAFAQIVDTAKRALA